MASKQRLDTLLAQRGLFESRSRAAASVMAGEVRVGTAGRRAAKPGELVDVDVPLAVDEPPRFVSRGGIKLDNALAASGVRVDGRLALDVGASTGGFTDCLLAHGASRVAAVDVAYGEFHWRLRGDPRVTVLERVNARHLVADQLPFTPDLAVVDVSFISLTKVLPAILPCLAPSFDVLALVKPQFEAGRGRVGSGGVVRDATVRRDTLLAVAGAARELGATVAGFHSSGLAGPKGNRETFIHLIPGGAREARQGDEELARLADGAEPADGRVAPSGTVAPSRSGAPGSTVGAPR